ncbi:prophage protein [Clostridium sp. NCR]|nr:prophage protein [Clostridium sp. NCR]
MLKTGKTITINGSSTIDGQVVVYMNASLSTDGTSNENINKNIQNQELYSNNKEAVRKDMRDFEDLVFEEQDKLSKSEI